MHSAVNKLAL